MFQSSSSACPAARGFLVLAAALGGAVLVARAALTNDCTPHWDSAIGQPGMNLTVLALGEYNGDLIAGGQFSAAGGQAVSRIARWDGAKWHPFESGGQIGVNHTVRAVTAYGGDLIAGGDFITAGGQTVNRIARWDGNSGEWHPFESGGQIGVDGRARALTVYNGDLIAGGGFTKAGGQLVHRIARWDGSSWHSMAGGMCCGANEVSALTEYNGDLIVGGTFNNAGGQTVNRIARWDGSAWHALGDGVFSPCSTDPDVNCGAVWALTVHDGDLIAGGFFTAAGGQTVNRIARWDGSAWHPLESGGQIGVGAPGDTFGGEVRTLTVYDGDLVAGGAFTTAGGQQVNRIARWDGSEWSAVGTGVASIVEALTVIDDGSGPRGGPALYAGGLFTSVGCLPANRIARWGCTEDGPKVGDLNLDGCVNVFDLLELLAQWGPCADCGDCPADLDGDCNVNVFDLLALLANWG